MVGGGELLRSVRETNTKVPPGMSCGHMSLLKSDITRTEQQYQAYLKYHTIDTQDGELCQSKNAH